MGTLLRSANGEFKEPRPSGIHGGRASGSLAASRWSEPSHEPLGRSAGFGRGSVPTIVSGSDRLSVSPANEAPSPRRLRDGCSRGAEQRPEPALSFALKTCWSEVKPR